MRKGKWFLCFWLKAYGFNNTDDDVFTARKVKIYFSAATNEQEAKTHARAYWSNKSFDTLPFEFRRGIEQDDELKFLNPTIVCEGGRFEKKLIVP